jgi:flagellar biosynthetic protein FliO
MIAKTAKIVAFSLVTLASFAAPVSASIDPSRDAGLSPNTAPNEPVHPITSTQDSIFARDTNFVLGTDRQFDTGPIYWRMMLAILLVLALGVAAYYVSKKVSGKIVNLPNRKIKLVETLYLGSKKSLHLIKVGDRNILVGTTPTNIIRIADLSKDTGDSSAADDLK